MRRAGLDYWTYVDLTQHDSFEKYLSTSAPKRIWPISKFGKIPYFKAEFDLGDALVFGSETSGLGPEFLGRFPAEQILRIPMDCAGVRSLNLSNAVSIVLYEARRQFHERGILPLERE